MDGTKDQNGGLFSDSWVDDMMDGAEQADTVSAEKPSLSPLTSLSFGSMCVGFVLLRV